MVFFNREAVNEIVDSEVTTLNTMRGALSSIGERRVKSAASPFPPPCVRRQPSQSANDNGRVPSGQDGLPEACKFDNTENLDCCTRCPCWVKTRSADELTS